MYLILSLLMYSVFCTYIILYSLCYTTKMKNALEYSSNHMSYFKYFNSHSQSCNNEIKNATIVLLIS